MAIARGFKNGTLDIYILNFLVITLIPKENDARDLRKFGPISLSNCAISFLVKL